jgi:tRNA U34 5-methylaminomethyl-2-thiouridine-forming methyltransferase MnmC
MAIPQRLKSPTGSPGLQWVVTDDGSRTLWHEQLDETYHSGCGAIAESMIVYLQNSRILERLESSQKSSVMEYGFGTGTAFLLTAAVAELHGTPLRYRSLERDLLPPAIFEGLALEHTQPVAEYRLRFQPVLQKAKEIQAALVAFRRSIADQVSPGQTICNLTNHVQLELWIGDACDYHCPIYDADQFDAVYFDAFSPESCPELWTRAVFAEAFKSLRPMGTFTSYCVKSMIRRELADVGFEVQKKEGPIGGKREVLLAIKPDRNP